MILQPNIIRLFGVYNESQHIYLVLEHMKGGELFHRIVERNYYNESVARDTCLIIFRAIRYCHDRKVAHRDLKPVSSKFMNDAGNKVVNWKFPRSYISPYPTLFLSLGFPPPPIITGYNKLHY